MASQGFCPSSHFCEFFFVCVINPDRLTKFVSVLHHHADRLFFECYLFIHVWLLWVFPDARGLSLVAVIGFSSWWLPLLRNTGARHPGFSSCSVQAQLLCGMWDLPRSGIKLMSTALPGGFLTTKPAGKSH